MRIVFESSFLQDLRRTDNIIEMNKYSYSEIETVYESAIIIFESETNILKLNLDDDADKSNVSTISFYYKQKGVEGDSKLAFTIYLDGSILDPKKNIFEVSLDFERTIYNEPIDFTPETKVIISGEKFQIGCKDKIILYNELSEEENYIKITTSDEILFEGIPESNMILDYNEKINQRGIVITGNNFRLDKIKLDLENPVKSTFFCPSLNQDNKFLLQPSDYGTSLYKDFKIIETKLVWKDSYKKYANTEGLNSESDAKIMESREGNFITPSRFIRSYSNLSLYTQGMGLDGINEVIKVQEDQVSDMPENIYHCWDSPMIDSIETEEIPVCIEKYDKFLNPNEVFYGNPDTNYLQYLKIEDPEVYAIKVTGLPNSIIEFRFNKESDKGDYISKQITLDENGEGKVDIDKLDFVHLNNIRTITTNKIKSIYFVTKIEVDKVIFVPTGEGNIYLKDVSVDTEFLNINGSCDYIEYEIQGDIIKEHSRGSISVSSIPEVNIELIEFGELNYTIDRLLKKINLSPSITSGTIPYAIFRLSIDNNYVYDGVELKTEKLTSDINLKIRQLVEVDVYWKLNSVPDYYEQEKGLFILENQITEEKIIYLETNDPNLLLNRELLKIDPTYTDQEVLDTFNIEIDIVNIVYSESKYLIPIKVIPKTINQSPSWIPSISGIPGLLCFSYQDNILSGCQFYLVQKPTTESLQIWDCITGDSYSSCYNESLDAYRIELTPSETYRKFIIVSDNSSLDSQTWYHIKSSSSDFEIRQNDITPDIKTRGTIIYNAYGSDIIHLSDSSARSYLFCGIEVTEDLEIGTFEISTSSVSSGWRSIVMSNNVKVSVFRTAQENQFSATSLLVNGIGVYSSEVYTNFKFRAHCSEDSGIKIFTDPNTLSNDAYYSELLYDGYFVIRFAVTKWPIDIPENDYLIKIYNTDSDIAFTGIDVIGEDSELTQNYIDSDKTISRRLFFLDNDNSISNQIETEIVSNRTPDFDFLDNPYSSVISGFLQYATFTEYTYRKHNIRFNLSRPSNSIYNSYFPVSKFSSIVSNQEGLKFYTYVKGFTNKVWTDDITEYTGTDNDKLESSLLNKKNTEFNAYFEYNEGSERIIRVFSRYITSWDSIWKFEDSSFFMLGNEHMRLEDYSRDWQYFSNSDTDFTRYYKDYKLVTLQDNLGGDAIYMGSVTLISMVNYDNLQNNIQSYLLQENDKLVSDEDIDINYAKNNILPVSIENIKINFYQLGKLDRIEVGDLTPFNAVGERRQVAVTGSTSVTVLNATPSRTQNCSVESQISSGRLNLSIVTYPRVSSGILTTNFNSLVQYIDSQAVGFKINITYKNSVGRIRYYEKLLETTQSGFSQVLMVRSGSGVTYYAIGPAENTTIDILEVVRPEGDTVELLCGIVEVNRQGPIQGTYIKEPDVTWVKNSASYQFSTSTYSDSATNLTINFPARDIGDSMLKEYIVKLDDPDERFNTSGFRIRFVQGGVSYYANFESSEVDVLSDGTVNGNAGYIYFTTNIREYDVSNIVFESDTLEIVDWDDPIKITGQRYGVKIWFTPNGSGNFRYGLLRINYLDNILGSTMAVQGHFSLRLKPYEASYSLVPVDKQRVYHDLDLHNFIATDEDVNYITSTDNPVMTVFDSNDNLGISIELTSQVSGGNLYYPTSQNVTLITVIKYISDSTEYITESSGKDHLVALDPEKYIESVEILAKSGWEGDSLTVTFGELELNYEPDLVYSDFVLPPGSTSTWQIGILDVPSGVTETLTFTSPEYLNYCGDKLTFTTLNPTKFNIVVTYKDGIVDSKVEDTVLREHSIILSNKKFISSIRLENLVGNISFTGIELLKNYITLSLSEFIAVGDEVTWDSSRYILRTYSLSDYIYIDLGNNSKYEGKYTQNQVYLETTEKTRLHVVIEYVESNEITNYTDSTPTYYHHISIPSLTKISSIKIYNEVVGRVQFSKDIELNPIEYNPQVIYETNLNDPGLDIVYASTSETPNISSVTHTVPCKTEKDNGSSIYKITRKIFYPDLLLQEPGDSSVISLRDEGLVSGNWVLDEVTWENNSGKTLVSEFFDAYGGVLVTEYSEKDYVYSKNIPYFESTYVAKSEYIPISVTVTSIFKVIVKNTNSRHDYQHLGINNTQTFRFGYKLEKAAEQLT